MKVDIIITYVYMLMSCPCVFYCCSCSEWWCYCAVVYRLGSLCLHTIVHGVMFVRLLFRDQ